MTKIQGFSPGLTVPVIETFVTAQAQTETPANSKPQEATPAATDSTTAKPQITRLGLRAALILTTEFCATEFKSKGGWATKEHATFEVGKAACLELEPALTPAFTSVTRVTNTPTPQDAQVILIPKIVDVNATTAMGAFSNREMVVIIEWTVQDPSGKTLWIGTVQGSAKHHIGNVFSHGKNVTLIVNDSVKAAAEQSAGKLSAAPELQKLAQ